MDGRMPISDFVIEYRARDTDMSGAPLPRAWITGLSAVAGGLAMIATACGILTGFGAHHRTFLSLRGETVTMQGSGLYANDSLSGASQAIGQDFVTLLVAVPLLAVATWLALRGSLRGRILRSGALLYFAYTYLLMAFGSAYNPLFLVYVAVFSSSLFALVLSLLSIDAGHLRSRFSGRFRRRLVGWVMIGFGSLLAAMWIGRIAPSLLGGNAPVGLDSYSTLFVQAGDLAIVVPLTISSGILLLQRRPAGYLLAGVMLVKGSTFGLALIGMIVAMAAMGTQVVIPEAVFFTTLALTMTVCAVHFISCLPRLPKAKAREISLAS